MKRKVMITVGGTAGHVNPAQVLAEQLHKMYDVRFIGGKLNKNPHFSECPYHLIDVPCAPLMSKNPFTIVKNTYQIIAGVNKSRKELKQWTPDLMVGFGSYHTFPVLSAARLLGIPTLLHEANSVPGKVNRLFSNYSMVTGIHFPRAAKFLKGKTSLVDMPLREKMTRGTGMQEKAREYFGLDVNRFTILVFGGSQGARMINQRVAEALAECPTEKIQVIHFSGQNGHSLELEKSYQQIGLKAKVKLYEDNMHFAWEASDLVIARAGAGTIAEQIAYSVPAIFIPFPYATDGHQEHNARFVESFGGAEVILERDCLPSILSNRINHYIENREYWLSVKEAINTHKSTSENRIPLVDLVFKTLEGL